MHLLNRRWLARARARCTRTELLEREWRGSFHSGASPLTMSAQPLEALSRAGTELHSISAWGCRPVSKPGVVPCDWPVTGGCFWSCQRCSHAKGRGHNSTTTSRPSQSGPLHDDDTKSSCVFSCTSRRAGQPSLEMHQKGLAVLLSTLASSRVAAAGSLPRGVGPECKSPCRPTSRRRL